MNYQKYKKQLLNLLIDEVQKATGKRWEDGLWAPKKVRRPHILPLLGDNNNEINRANAIRQYMGFDCSPYFDKDFNGLHTYAHHINSSQITCLMFFGKLTEKHGDELKATQEMVDFIKKAFGIEISTEAVCQFEYEDKRDQFMFDVDYGGNIIKGKYEGTSFDFHIKDGDVEIFFEIKLTEEGFGKPKAKDIRHQKKAEQYFDIAPDFLKNSLCEPLAFLNHYQIYRNIIRVTDSNKYVVFIADENNPATNVETERGIIEAYKANNVRFITWQEIIEVAKDLSIDLPFQLKAIKKIKRMKQEPPCGRPLK